MAYQNKKKIGHSQRLLFQYLTWPQKSLSLNSSLKIVWEICKGEFLYDIIAT